MTAGCADLAVNGIRDTLAFNEITCMQNIMPITVQANSNFAKLHDNIQDEIPLATCTII